MNTVQSTHGASSGQMKKENMLEELVSITPNERNWRGICISLLVIATVLGLILFFIVLLSPPYTGPFNPGIKFTVDQITGPEFKAPIFNGTWISGSELVFRDPDGGVSIYNANDNSIKPLLSNSSFRQLNAVEFKVSADLNYILLLVDIEKVDTNTRKARYYVQDVNNLPNRIPLSPLPRDPHDNKILQLQEVIWSPRGNSLAFVHENDIYYKESAISHDVIHRITRTGSHSVSNGFPDWLYQEEILKGRPAIWFSKDGKYLAYATFNDTFVGQFKYPVFKTNLQYPEIYSLHYPKVGTSNPDVTINIVNLQNINESHVTLKKSSKVSFEGEPYIINVVWANNGKLGVVWLDRGQNNSVISICSPPSWKCSDAHVERALTGGWLEPSPDIIFSNDSLGLITILSVMDGKEGYYPQICHIDVKKMIVTPITHSQFVVTNIKAWDQIHNVIYFEAAPEGKPRERHLYNVSDSLSMTFNKWTCLTCPDDELVTNITEENIPKDYLNGTALNSSFIDVKEKWPVRNHSCIFIKTYFSPSIPVLYYALECLGPGIPKVIIMSIESNSPVFMMNNYTELAEKYGVMAKPQIKTIEIELQSGFQAQVKLLFPPVLRERLQVEFPFLLYVGDSVGSQSVVEKWSVDWNTHFVSNHNIIIGIVDGRGSSGQRDQMKHQIKRNIGVIDIQDQLAVLMYLRENIKFIDRTRVGIWGKGYGGYLAGKLMEQDDEELFRCAVAVAPIVNWNLHVSVWTERFMGTPNITDNYRGYEDADLSQFAHKFRDKKFLIIHGTADKKVHYQHSMKLAQAFIDNRIQFRHLTYPDEDHDFSKSEEHVIQAMELFWQECFGPTEYEDYDEGLSFLSFAQ